MKQFKFFLQLSHYVRGVRKLKKKEIVIDADDFVVARKTIESQFPDWEISMCWPVV